MSREQSSRKDMLYHTTEKELSKTLHHSMLLGHFGLGAGTEGPGTTSTKAF